MISELIHLLERTDDNSYKYRKKYHIVYKYHKKYLLEFLNAINLVKDSINNEEINE